MRSLLLFRKSLVGRLTLAFSLLAFLLLLLITLASLSLFSVNQADEYLYNQALPASKAARQLVLAANALADNAQELGLVQAESQRQIIGRKLSINSATMFAAINTLSTLQVNTDLSLKQTASNIVANLSNLGEHVEKRMHLAYLLNLQGKNLVQAANKSTELLQAELAVVDSSILAKLSLAYPKTADTNQTNQLLDDVIEIDLDIQERLNQALKIVHNIALMGQVFQSLKLDSSLINFIKIASDKNNNKDKPQANYDEYIYSLNTLNNLNDIIRDPVRASLLNKHIKALHQLPESIRLKQQFNDQNRSQEVQLQTISDRLFTLNQTIDTLMHAHQVQANIAREAYLQQLNWSKAGLWITGLLMILIMILIAYHVIYRGIAIKLNQATIAMTQLSLGNTQVNLDSPIWNAQGDDEITAMASAIKAFKHKTDQNQILQTELQDTATQLFEHKQALENTVEERTRELAETNKQLDREAQGHLNAREMAEQANQAKSLFLATMSHEIRTPLNGLLGTLTLLGQSNLPPAQQQMLTLSQYSGTLLLTVLNDVLDFSRLEQGKLTNEPRPVDIQKLLDEVIAIMLAGASLAGLNLTLNSDILPAWINIDGPKLRQVLFNLIGNAIKFTPSGEVNVNVTISDQQLSIEVHDTGVGISTSAMDNLFKAYNTQPSQGRTQGTGLGLTISKQLVCLMKDQDLAHSNTDMKSNSGQQDLWVSSTEGQGCCFGFSLPFTPCQAAEIIAIEKTHRVAAKNVLIIEDNQINAIVAQGFLAHLGHVSVLANSCDSVRKLLSSESLNNFDAIMLDIQLADGSGIDLLHELKAMGQTEEQQPIIAAFTAQLQTDDIVHYKELGFDHVLAKPLDMHVLAQWLGTAALLASASETTMTFSDYIDEQQLKDDLHYLGIDAVNNMLRLYQESSAKQIAQLSAQPEQACTLLHALKGSSFSMGLIRLGNLCQEIEHTLSASNQGYQVEQHQSLCQCLQLSLQALTVKLESCKE